MTEFQILFELGLELRDALRFMEETLGAGLWTVDLQSFDMKWSAGMFSLLGLAHTNVPPSYAVFRSLVHPGDRRVEQEMDRLMRDGVRFERVLRIVRPDGRLRWLLNRCEPLVGPSGRPERAMGLSQDVTHQRDTLQRGEWIEERYRVLLAATNAAVWTLRPDGGVAELCIRTDRGDLAVRYSGDDWKDLIHPDDVSATLSGWRGAVTGPPSPKFEHRIRGPDGDYRWYRSHAVRVKAAADSDGEWIGVSLDVHHQRTWPPPAHPDAPVTGHQVRAGRGLLKWSVRRLSEASGVASATIRKIERVEGPLDIAHPASPLVRDALVNGGVEFLDFPDGNPGIRARHPAPAKNPSRRPNADLAARLNSRSTT